MKTNSKPDFAPAPSVLGSVSVAFSIDGFIIGFKRMNNAIDKHTFSANIQRLDSKCLIDNTMTIKRYSSFPWWLHVLPTGPA